MAIARLSFVLCGCNAIFGITEGTLADDGGGAGGVVEGNGGADGDGGIGGDVGTGGDGPRERLCAGAGMILYDFLPNHQEPLSETNRYTIWGACPDGSSVQRMLPESPGHDSNANWHPDGQRFTFVRHANGIDAIMMAKFDGTEVEQLVRTPPGAKANPIFSPDGATVAFIATPVGAASSKIMLVDADGSNLRRLTATPAEDPDAVEGFFTWTPDGQAIAMRFGPDGQRRILVHGLDGSVRPLLGEAESFNPVISPDGDWIFYTHLPAGTAPPVEVWRMRPDGSSLARVLEAGSSACFSPDGERFVVHINGEGRIGVASSSPPHEIVPIVDVAGTPRPRCWQW